MKRTVEQIMRAQKIFNDIVAAIPAQDKALVDTTKFLHTDVSSVANMLKK